MVAVVAATVAVAAADDLLAAIVGADVPAAVTEEVIRMTEAPIRFTIRDRASLKMMSPSSRQLPRTKIIEFNLL